MIRGELPVATYTYHPALGRHGHRLQNQACFPINSPPLNALAQHLANDDFEHQPAFPNSIHHQFSVSPSSEENQEGRREDLLVFKPQPSREAKREGLSQDSLVDTVLEGHGRLGADTKKRTRHAAYFLGPERGPRNAAAPVDTACC